MIKFDSEPQVLMSTQAFPPSIGGTPFLLYDLLKHFPANALVIVSGPWAKNMRSEQELPFENHQVIFFNSFRWTQRISVYLPNIYIKFVTRRILSVARQFNIKRIYAHYPNALFTIAAYLAAKELGLPLTIYFDILWSERGDAPHLAAKFEHEIVQYSDMHFAMTEFAVEFLSKKHGVTFTLLPTTVDASKLTNKMAAVDNRVKRIHFAGGIYHNMNQDAVQRLANVVSRMDDNIVLDLYTPKSKDRLVSEGFPTRNINYGYIDRTLIQAIQQQSDILYLPQAFESPYPEMIRNNFPTKTLEYITANRPMLVHTPADSYLASQTQAYNMGMLVTEPSEEDLYNALQKLLNDLTLQQKLVLNSVSFASTRDSRKWSKFFYNKLYEQN